MNTTDTALAVTYLTEIAEQIEKAMEIGEFEVGELNDLLEAQKKVVRVRDALKNAQQLTTKDTKSTKASTLDYTVEEIEDGTFEIWTPDMNGGCGSRGKSQGEALRKAAANLATTAAALDRDAATATDH